MIYFSIYIIMAILYLIGFIYYSRKIGINITALAFFIAVSFAWPVTIPLSLLIILFFQDGPFDFNE